MGKIMATGAQINFLGNRGPSADLDLAKRVGVGPITETGPVVQDEVPRNLDPGALMDEWFAVDPGAENVEPEESPRIGRLGRPPAKEEPAKLPEQAQGAVARGPGRFLRETL